MGKRSIRNVLQVVIALLLLLPPLAAPMQVAATGPTNIEVSKTIVTNPGGSGYTVIAGATVRFRISVENTAPDGAGTLGDAEDVVVYDYMTPGFELVPGPNSPSIPATYVEVSPGVYRFELGTILATDGVAFEFDAKIAPDIVADQGGVYAFDNTATAIVRSPFADDTDEQDSTFNLHLTVLEDVRELYVTKVDAAVGSPSIAGAANEYWVGIVNPGPSSARQVMLVDTLDPDEEFLSVEFLNGSGICSYIASTHQLNCNLGVVDPSEVVEQGGAYIPSVAMIIHTRIASSVPDDTFLRNDVAISWLQSEMPGGDDVLTDSDYWESHVLRDNMLTIEKQSYPNPVTAGETLFYVITVTNDGPSDAAAGLELGDVLPAGVTFVSAADNGEWTEVAPGSSYRLNHELPAGESASLVLEVETATSLYYDTLPGAMITNRATALSTEMDVDQMVPASVSEDTFIAEEADLAIVKVGKPDGVVLAGETLEYTVYVYNLGPSDARNVHIWDDVLSIDGVAYDDTQPLPFTFEECEPGWGCSITFNPTDPGDFVDMYVYRLPAGERVVFTMRITATEAVDVNNLVQVESDTPDPDTNNNSAMVMNEFLSVADLRLAKNLVSGGTPPVAGTNITFQYDVENLGPSEATNVVLKEYIPDGLTFVSSSGPDCALEGNVLTCAYGNIPAGATRPGLNITFAIDPAFEHGKTLLNSAEVKSDVLDTNMRNNVDTWAGTVAMQADLQLVKFAVGAPVAGQVIHYEYQIRNLGPSKALDVWMRDFLPSDVELVSASVDVGEGTCSLAPGSNALFCDLGDLDPDAFVMIFVGVRIKSSVAAGAVLTNSADVHSLYDPDPANNGSSAEVTVRRLADVVVSKESSPNPVTAGDKLTYQVTVTNNGPSDASFVRVEDTLPAGVTFVAMADNGEWTEAEPGSAWVLASLPAGQSAGFSIEAQTASDLYITELADDMLVTNNICVAAVESAEVCTAEDTYIAESADLLVKKVGKPDDMVLAGEELAYTIQVYNLGQSDARNVRVLDDIMNNLGEGFQVLVADPAPVQEPDGTWVFSWDVIPAGEMREVSLVIMATEDQSINNLVHVEADTPDPDMANNDALVMTEVVAVSDLAIVKFDPLPVLVAGGPAEYLLMVTNLGPSTAENVVVKDYLPRGAELISVITPQGEGWMGGTPGNHDDPAIINLGSMAPGETIVVSVTVLIDVDFLASVDYDFIGWMINDAEVSSDTLDPNNANNIAHCSLPVGGVAELEIIKGQVPDPTVAGTIMEWPIVVTNYGPSVAQNVQMIDPLDGRLEFIEVSMVSGEAQCQLVWSMNMITCELGDMYPGDTVVMNVRTHVRPDVENGAVIENTAYVSSRMLFALNAPEQFIGYPLTPDPNPENNQSTDSGTVYRQSWLKVTKESTPNPVVAGGKLFYEITVCNEGPSVATDIMVADWLPGQVEYIDFTGPEWWLDAFQPGSDINPPTGWWRTPRTLYPGECSSFMVQVLVPSWTTAWEWNEELQEGGVDPYGTEVLHNRACGNWAEAPLWDDPNDDPDMGEQPAGSCTGEDTFVEEVADLQVVKIGKPDDTVRAGEELTYTVYVYNLGLSDARNVVVTDNILSDGVFSDPVVNSELYDCAVNGGEIVCTLDVHPAGTRAEFTITVTAGEEVDINNWTCVASATPDPNADNNCATVMTSVVPVSDLSISKSVVGEGPWYAGGQVTFEITVSNDGPSTAENVVVADYLPAFVTLVGISADVVYTAGVPGDPNAPMIIPLGTLAAGEQRTFQFDLRIDASYPFDLALGGEFLVNDAMVSSDVLDDDISNNRASAAIYVQFASELGVSKTATPETVQAGETVVYTINVWNDGPSTAYNVLVVDAFDSAYLTMVDYEIGNGTGTCLFVAAESAVLCNIGDMVPNDGRVISMTFLVSADTLDGMQLVNTVDVGSESSEITARAEATITVVNNADLEVTKTADKLEVYAGQQLTYTIGVVNNGPTNAVNVVVIDTLPAGVTYVNDDLGACELNESELNCSLGDLAAGQTATFKVLVTVDADTQESVCNWAAVMSDTTDLGEGLNEDGVCTPVNGHADLRVKKFGKPEGTVRAGEELTYTILVDNLGTGVAHGVTLVDNMTSNGSFVLDSVWSSLPVNETLAEINGEFFKSGSFTLTLAEDLPITLGGEPWIITVVAMANDDQVINNCAVVDGADFDPNVANNEACAEHEITNVADLRVTKTAEGEVQVDGEEGGVVAMQENAVTAGRFLYYTITVMNDGPSLAENVVVVDALPAGVVFIESDVPADMSQLPGKLIWNLGDKASGHGEIIQVKVLVPAHTPEGTVLRNTVVAMSDVFDDNNANNSSSNETYVGAAADLAVTKTSMPETALFGNGIEYTIMVKNLGPSDAGLVKITDFIPDEIDGEQWKYTTDGGMTFTEGWLDVNAWVDMPVGEMVVLTISGVVNTYWPFANTACVESVAIVDPLVDDNCATAENVQTLVFKPIEMRGLDVTSHAPDLTVSKIVATESYIELTVSNIGDRSLLEPFWVDLYINPSPAPTGVNQTWEALCDVGQGWAWKVTGDNGLPLLPGESFILVVDIEDSATIFPLAPGTQIYAQADSWNPETDWGMVLEQDEKLSLPYNNIRWATRSDWQFPPATRDEGSVIRGAESFGAADDGLPARP